MRSAVGFLELINNMLTLGMVPALYTDEEKEQVIGQVGIIYLSLFTTKSYTENEHREKILKMKLRKKKIK